MERQDIQGLLFSGYGRLRASACISVRFAEGRPHVWLRRLLPWVSSGARHEEQESLALQLAFTYDGLARLGLAPGVLAQFPREFRHGMAHAECARRLGDVGEDDPKHWTFGGGASGAFDALLLVYASGPAELAARLAELEREREKADLRFELLHTYLREDGSDHFGFRMSVSQPRFRGDGRGRSAERRLAAGEFVLGYRDEAGLSVSGPSAPLRASSRESPPLMAGGVDLGFNGSYLVLRKLEQRVDALKDWLARAALEQREALAAKLVGRWPNGASLAQHPFSAPSAERAAERVSYAADARGLGCPLGAHVRRAHPRDALPQHVDVQRHRLLRRGRLYAQSDGGCGLLFMALNADIARQFEVVQGRWLNDAHFAGLRGERDPLLGSDEATSGAALRPFTIQREPVRERVALPRLTRLVGGAYCFLPSLRALGYLADLRSLA